MLRPSTSSERRPGAGACSGRACRWRLLQTSLVLLAVADLAGCGGAGAGTGSAAPIGTGEPPRRAPGVAVDPVSELPEAGGRAEASESIVVLEPLPPAEAAVDVVDGYFDAIRDGDDSRLQGLLARDARFDDLAGDGDGDAQSHWQQRSARHDYTRLAGARLQRSPEAEIIHGGDDGGARRPPFPLEREREVAVHVVMLVTHLGQRRVFGDEVWFRLRAEAGRYQIVEIAEALSTP